MNNTLGPGFEIKCMPDICVQVLTVHAYGIYLHVWSVISLIEFFFFH